METFPVKIIARIENDFTEKFGIPRQSGLADSVISRIVFEPEYRNDDALRGIEDFSHLWLIWQFSMAVREDWSPTVRPPRLGGNTRLGVFATRSPFRPNPLGLSSVRLLGTEKTEQGTVLLVAGADLMNGTPIFDIKPYIPLSDCHPDASEGYTKETKLHLLQVECDEALLAEIPEDKQTALLKTLAQDPRPAYLDDPTREYGITFGKHNVKFKVAEDVLTVTKIEEV
jgi:tRNA-Thr(GGU) m(6)t(6)A37 methyltransferase TsaA